MINRQPNGVWRATTLQSNRANIVETSLEGSIIAIPDILEAMREPSTPSVVSASDLWAWIVANGQASYGLNGAGHLIKQHFVDSI